MRAIDAPPVVDEDIERAEHNHEERSGPLRLEADGNHCARAEPNKRDKYATDAPFTSEHESDEQEDE